MNKIYLLPTVFLLCLACHGLAESPLYAMSDKVTVSVDPRVEAVSIIFFLAGSKEYGQCLDKEYLEKVKDYFTPYKNHPAVKTAASLRDGDHVSYGAPMSLACHMEEDFTLPSDVKLNSDGGSLDSRFTLREAKEFATQVKEFATLSKLDLFMRENKERYTSVEEGLQAIVDRLDPSWFSGNLPVSGQCSFKVFVSLMNGANNYGIHRKTASGYDVTPVIGVWSFDKNNSPQFGTEIWDILLHECSHPFFNPLADEYMNDLRGAAIELARERSADFSRTGYAKNGRYSDDLVYESLAWAGAILYTEEHEGTKAADELKTDVTGQGWTWISDIVNWLKGVRESGTIKSDPQKAMKALAETFSRSANSKK